MGKVTTALGAGAWVFGGELGTGVIANFIPLAKTGVTGLAVRAGSAVITGIGFGFVNPRAGALAMAGGFASLYRALFTEYVAVKSPFFAAALGTASAPVSLTLAAGGSAPAGATAGYALPSSGMRGYAFGRSSPTVRGVI